MSLGIQATVLQYNHEQYFCDPCGGYGKTLYIPCGNNVARIDEQYWAVPVKNGYVQGFRYVSYDSSASAPTFDSLQAFKLTNILTGEWYVVVGTPADYYAACCADCDASPVPDLIATLDNLSTEQYACTTDGTNYDAFFAVQTLGVGERFVSTTSADGVLVKQQTYAAGSTSLANLIIYLNANSSSVGTWSNPAANTVRLRTTSAKWVGFVACNQTS